MKQFFRRLSIYGDFWVRYLHWAVRHCPWFLEPVFVFAFTMMFWIVLGKGRRAVVANLAVVLPGSSPIANQFRALRVFWNFAWTMVDLAHVRHGEDCIRWEISGMEHLDTMTNQEKGSILLTAHMGNYDVAAPLLVQKIQRPTHLVRAPERQRESQEFQRDRREQHAGGNFVIHYNEPGSMLGVELVHALGDGGIVAIQGDRVLFDVSPLAVPFRDGVSWQVPRGPFMLALVARVAIHPVFIIRMGWRHYRVQAEAPMVADVPSRDRERSVREMAQTWTAVVRRVMEQHWRQWFVFEPVFQKATPEPSAVSAVSQEQKLPADTCAMDSVIPANSGRTAGIVFVWSLLVGGWTSAVVLRRLLEWAVGDWRQVLLALAMWPVLWFLIIVGVEQAVMSSCALVTKLLRLPWRFFDALAFIITLAVLCSVAWLEIISGCHVGWWLGTIWLAALGPGLVVTTLLPHRSAAG